MPVHRFRVVTRNRDEAVTRLSPSAMACGTNLTSGQASSPTAWSPSGRTGRLRLISAGGDPGMAHPRMERRDAVAVGAPPLSLAVGHVRLSGELDAVQGPRLLAAVDRELARGCDLVYVDLAQVTYCNVEGLRALLWSARRLRDGGGRLVPRHPSGLVRTIAEVAGWADELGLRARSPSSPGSAWPELVPEDGSRHDRRSGIEPGGNRECSRPPGSLSAVAQEGSPSPGSGH